MRLPVRLLAVAVLAIAGHAAAQQSEPQPVPFEGGTLTVTETEDLDKVLAFNGTELARNFVLYYDRTVTLGETAVALYQIGDGGNACGTATVMVWKPKDGDVKSAVAGDDCGSPPPAVGDGNIVFVPYLRPGASAPVESWTPDGGMRLVGQLNFAPQPDTKWDDIDPAKVTNPYDLFDNGDFYAAAKALLGDDLEEVALGLAVSGGPETTSSGVIYGSGCVPHACGSADSFFAFDPRAHTLYFAQEGGEPEPHSWPASVTWPEEIQTAMKQALNQ